MNHPQILKGQFKEYQERQLFKREAMAPARGIVIGFFAGVVAWGLILVAVLVARRII